MYLPPDFLDPPYDYDFTHVNDSSMSFSRGGEVYKRPCGWLRYALKMGGKYGSDTWLGSSNAPGEWPVSYHGTGKHSAASIAEVGYQLAKGVRFAYGRGIYSSPNHTTAEQYAIEFSNQGRRYKVIFQNRVNPVNLYNVSGIDYWISPRDNDIRVYGLCVKEQQQRKLTISIAPLFFNLNILDVRDKSSLYKAVADGRYNNTKRVLEQGADALMRTSFQWTLLH